MKFSMRALATGFALVLLAAPVVMPVEAQDVDPDNAIVMELKCGEIVIKLRPDVAPGHVERIKQLSREGFYDGIIFHRVIEGFMAQTGDPTGTGMGGSERPNLQAEFSDAAFTRGVVGMARSSDPDSANSQFFIMFDDGRFLDGQYTVWGEVVQGMDCIDQINRGEPPADPDEIIRMRVMSDAQ
jgi:peptidylprolyl isomerase